MAKQFKMTKGGETVYPQTITDAIADSKRKEVLTAVLDGIDTNVSTAKSTADAAKTAASTAQSTADTAKANADAAQSTANTADANAKLANATTVATAVGKVPAGAKYDANTPVSSIINDILAFQTPSFSALSIIGNSTAYSSNTNIFCNSTAVAISGIKHQESNIASIKGSNITANFNGTKVDIAKSATSADYAKSVSFPIATNKASFYVELSGTNTLSADIPAKRVTITAYMPVYIYLVDSPTETNAKNGLASATNESTVFTGSKTYEKSLTVAQNQAICIATPSHLACGRLYNTAAGGYLPSGIEKTEISATRTVNGITGVPYTIYMTKALGATSEPFSFELKSK